MLNKNSKNHISKNSLSKKINSIYKLLRKNTSRSETKNYSEMVDSFHQKIKNN